MIFGRRPAISDEMRDWIVEALEWCAAHGLMSKGTPLVLPTAKFITAPSGLSPEETANALLQDVLRLSGTRSEGIKLAPIEVLPDEMRHQWGELSAVAGTWQADENQTLIRYDPTLLRQPIRFISVLAHEVMHERLSWLPRDWPGGGDVEELMTDLAAIACGFGAFQMADADTAGWSGYLRQESRAHALALCIRACGQQADDAMAHLPGRSAKALKRALRGVDTAPGDIERIADRLGGPMHRD